MAAAAAALGLRDEADEENKEALAAGMDPDDPAGWEADEEEDDPPLDEEAINGLKTEFRNSLVRVFNCMELSASVIQDKLSLNEPVDLIQTWDSDAALESACNNLIRGANHNAVNDEVPVFRFSMLQDLILYREWVHLRLSR
jgi:hypothetical protein